MEGMGEMKTGSTFDWAAQRVLVTGATGIVGSWLTRDLLARGAQVVALVRDADHHSELYRSGDIGRCFVVGGNVEDFRTLERAIIEHEVDSVFHLAAQTIVGTAHRSPLPTFEANIRGTYNLLEACRLHCDLVQRVVVASSDKAYGEQDNLPYTEDMPLNGRHPYDVSKSCADALAQTYQHTYGLAVGIARCGNVYGGGDLNWSRIVPGTIRALLGGDRPVIRSDGTYVRDYIYVKDVARAYIYLAERVAEKEASGQAYNFCADKPLSVLELVATIQEMMGARGLEPIIADSARGEIRNQHLSSEKARSALAWEPEFGLEEGLGETIDWYREFLAR